MNRESRRAGTLRVGVRVGGETKGSPTYHKLVEDLSRAGLGGAPIVEAGFLGYRAASVSAVVPTRPVREAAEVVASGLLAQLTTGIGVDPRSLAGTLFVLVRPPAAAGQPDVAALRREGYLVEASPELGPSLDCCEVRLEVVGESPRGAPGTSLVRFTATSSTDAGDRLVAVSTAWRSHLNRYVGLERRPEAAAAFDELVRRLLDGGWRPAEPGGPFWYSARFRRTGPSP